jgi:hypothetical protein
LELSTIILDEIIFSLTLTISSLEKSIYFQSLIKGRGTMEIFEVLVPIVLVLAAVLLFISILAYKRERSWRLLLVGVVFAILLIKGLIMSLSIFTTGLDSLYDSIAFHLLFDVIILLFLFFAVLNVPKRAEDKRPYLKDMEEGKT